jgi:hypothetical protein
MAPTFVKEPVPGVLLVGSFPPVGGPASAASIAALRRAWAEGDEVVTASLRAGTGDLVARVAGPLAGWRLERARRAAGRPPRLILGLSCGQFGLDLPQSSLDESGPSGDPVQEGVGTSVRRVAGVGVAALSVAGLVVSLGRFEQVTVLLTGPLGLPRPLRRLLWRPVDTVVVEAGGEGAAIAEGVPADRLRSVEPYQGPSRQAGVSLLGPPEVLPRDLVMVAAGALGRRLLGRHFLLVRSEVIRAGRRAQRALLAWRS